MAIQAFRRRSRFRLRAISMAIAGSLSAILGLSFVYGQATDGPCTADYQLNGDGQKKKDKDNGECQGKASCEPGCSTVVTGMVSPQQIWANNPIYACQYANGSSGNLHCVAQPAQDCSITVTCSFGATSVATNCSSGTCAGTSVGKCFSAVTGTGVGGQAWSTRASNQCN